MKNALIALKTLPKAVYAAVATTAVGAVAVAATVIATSSNDVFYDDFEANSLDTSKWLIAEKSWGGNNGGVIPENVSIENGVLKLEAHGNKYTGNIPGINQPTGVRTGAAIATRDYFASGSYEVIAKVAKYPGAVSAIWTFEYEEYYKGDPEYEKLGGKGSYTTVNHEIDIEIPGHIKKDEIPDFKHVNFNTFITETKDTSKIIELPTPQNDGEWHKYRFDWHTGNNEDEARVEYYVDDVLYETIKTTIPTKAGRFWIGVWFPAMKDSDKDGINDSGWAGIPDFDTAVFEVDSVKITPYHEKRDEEENETYGKDGWAVDSFPEDIEKESYNHIKNGDFKDGTNSWELSGDTKVLDEKALLSSGDKTDTISQKVKVLPKITYTLSADVETNGTKVKIGVKKSNGSNDISKTYTKSSHVCLTFETTSSMKELKAYAEVLRYQNSNELVKVDNIVLTSGKTCKEYDIEDKEEQEEVVEDDINNLVLNGDFSKKEENWKISGGTKFDGKRAILKSGNDTDTIKQEIKVKKLTKYKLTADVESTGSEITIGVKDYDGKYTKLYKTLDKTGKIEIEFETGKNIEKITVYAEVIRYQKNKENVYLDNVKLIEINENNVVEEPKKEEKEEEPVIEEEQPIYKSNLIVDGELNNESNWTLVGGARIENGKAYLASGKDTDIISQVINVKENTRYKFSADITTDNVEVDLYISGHNGKYTEVKNTFEKSTRGVLEFTTGANVKEIKIHVQVLRYQENDNVVIVDNLVLEEV